MSKITLLQAGDSLAMTIPTDMIERLGLQAGQEFTIVEVAGGFKLVPFDASLERQRALAYDVLRDEAETLKALARL
jgi:antitoxin component of MazEF toxin-antitoxin module